MEMSGQDDGFSFFLPFSLFNAACSHFSYAVPSLLHFPCLQFNFIRAKILSVILATLFTVYLAFPSICEMDCRTLYQETGCSLLPVAYISIFIYPLTDDEWMSICSL
jgi:hypothetical protein